MPPVNSSGSIKSRKGSRLSSGTTSSYRSSKTPSLLNGNGDGKSIATGADASRDPDASPSQSRSSSAQDSYSTSATTYEDTEDANATSSTTTAKTAGAKAKESKGNVIVSVRVRPDAGGNEAAKSAAEWGLDGRRGLISYKGKEGGEYHYGMIDSFLSI